MKVFNWVYQFWFTRNSQIVFWAALAAVFFGLVKLPTDPDLGWHLRQGEVIFSQHRFISADYFSYTMTGYPWTPYWLPDLVIYLVAKFVGFWFLTVLFAAIATAAIWLIVATFGSKKPFLSSLVIVVSLLLLYPFAGVRPQVISWLFAALILSFLVLGKYQKPFQIAFYPAIFLVWANFHFGFILGLPLIFLALAAELGKTIWRRFFGIGSQVGQMAVITKLTIILALSSIITLVNPNGLNLHRSALVFLTSKVNTENIAEWLPLNFRSDIGLVTVLVLVMMLIIITKNYRRLILFEMTVFAFLTLAGLTSVRNLPYWLIVAVVITLRSNLNLNFGKQVNIHFLQNFYYPAVVVVLAVALAFGAAKNVLQSDNLEKVAQTVNYPYQAVSYLKDHLPQGEMFNSYNWGGFLVWQLPEKRTFIDGRMPGWKVTDRDIMSDYLKIYWVSKDALPLLAKYQVSWALVPPDAPITAHLKVAGWQQIYADEVAVVLKK